MSKMFRSLFSLEFKNKKTEKKFKNYLCENREIYYGPIWRIIIFINILTCIFMSLVNLTVEEENSKNVEKTFYFSVVNFMICLLANHPQIHEETEKIIYDSHFT